MRTSSISACGSLPGWGEARCNTPLTPAKQSVLLQLCVPFAPTFESLGVVSANDIIDTNDLHTAFSMVRIECLLDIGDFGGADSSED